MDRPLKDKTNKQQKKKPTEIQPQVVICRIQEAIANSTPPADSSCQNA